MNLAEIDTTLARLQADADTIGANLLELERDPNRLLLETATLTGQTAERWTDATKALGDIWKWYTRFTELLEHAAGVRGPRLRISPDREEELTQLLTGPSIELARELVPLRDRALLSAGQSTTRCTPDELLATMSQEFDRVRDVVVTAGSAWDTLVPRLRDLRARLAEAKTLAVELGEDGADVDELQQRVDRLGEAVASDPLSVNAREFDTLESDLGRLRVSLDGATQLRDEMRERVAKARAVLDELRGAIRAATAAHREVIVKIAAPHVPEPPTLDDGLVRELDTAVALSEQSRWRAAQDALSEWSDRADAQLRRADECATANRRADRRPQRTARPPRCLPRDGPWHRHARGPRRVVTVRAGARCAVHRSDRRRRGRRPRARVPGRAVGAAP